LKVLRSNDVYKAFFIGGYGSAGSPERASGYHHGLSFYWFFIEEHGSAGPPERASGHHHGLSFMVLRRLSILAFLTEVGGGW
jgi:hypothetical protein